MQDPRLRSKWWRLTHLYKILNKQGNLVTFKPNLPQTLHLWAREHSRVLRLLLVKARQFGFTTLYAIDLLDDACFVPGMSCAILAHEREAVDKIFEIVKRAYENMPEELKPTTRRDTLRAYRFETRFDGVPLDSTIYVALKLRSTTVLRLHITEGAYIRNRQELEAGSKQAVPLNGRITEETTGNGFNAFYDAFMEAWSNKNPGKYDNHAYFYPWFQNAEYTLPGQLEHLTKTESDLRHRVKREFNHDLTDGQIQWRRWKMRDLKVKGRNGEGNLAGLSGEQLFKQEYPSTVMEAFQSGAGSVFDTELIEEAMAKVRPVLRVQDGLTIWVEPVPGHRYVIGGDPSDGMGADYGAFDVWDLETLEQVAQFVAKLRPDELAEKIKWAAEMHEDAYTGVENNMLSTVLFLSKIYWNLHVTVKEDERTKKITRKLGFTTTGQSRDLMIDEFIVGFEDGDIKINSPVTLDQMRTFVKKDGGKREHADNKFDDALFAGMIAYQMRKYFVGRITEKDVGTAGDYSTMYPE